MSHNTKVKCMQGKLRTTLCRFTQWKAPQIEESLVVPQTNLSNSLQHLTNTYIRAQLGCPVCTTILSLPMKLNETNQRQQGCIDDKIDWRYHTSCTLPTDVVTYSKAWLSIKYFAGVRCIFFVSVVSFLTKRYSQSLVQISQQQLNPGLMVNLWENALCVNRLICCYHH